MRDKRVVDGGIFEDGGRMDRMRWRKKGKRWRELRRKLKGERVEKEVEGGGSRR